MAPAARDYSPGERVPGSVYDVIRRIGAGGMGTVYDVEDTSIGKRYVLKTLHPQLGARDDLVRRMQNEARTLARLHHPNIVEIITAGVTTDDLRLPYYVMERLSGQSLRVVLEKKGLLELPHAVHIAIDLLDALDHAHDKGVIHRDVKPDNIFLHRTSANLTVTKLLDFGIVSLLDAAARETAGRFLGTLRYASPEQLRGSTPTAKMDLYCAALVLYEMIAARGPFDDQGDSNAVARAHLDVAAPPVSQFALVPRELDRLIAAALAKDPNARPRDADSFASSLRNIKRAMGGNAGEVTTGNRATSMAALDAPPGSASVVAVQQHPAADGRYVVAPAPAPEAPRTTVRGMVAPTVGRPFVEAPVEQRTSTSAQSVDREAATRTLAVEGQGPTAQVAETVPWSPAAPADPAIPLRWPPESPVARSEEPQVSSLSAELPRSQRAPVVMVISAAVGLFIVLSSLTVLRHQASLRAAPELPPVPSSAASALVVAPLPEPVVTVPAPTLALPALDDPAPSSPPSASTSLAKPSGPRPWSGVVALPPATSALRPARPPAPPTPAAPDRPGPGF